MITEDYVSFETAKLLKEMGFESDECIAIYDLGDNNAFIRDSGIFENGPEDYLEFQWGEEWRRFGYYLAPTLQMAMKWLREVHNKSIEVRSQGLKSTGLEWVTGIYNLKNQDEEYYNSFTQSSYEQACEAAIQYCLENLI